MPFAGVIVSFGVFAFAASRYPGGYDWTRDFVSDLFAPTTASGAANTARLGAVVAMFVLCTSLAVSFKLVSLRATGMAQAKLLEIGGIGSAIYAFLVVTPLHDLLVGVGLLFFFPAMAAALHLARAEGRRVLVGSGLVSVGLLIVSAAMYYGKLAWHLLPIAQKVSMSACIGWVLALQLARVEADRGIRGAR